MVRQSRAVAVLLALVALSAATARPAPAQDPAAAFRGTFVRDAAASDTMEEIVDAGMSKLGRLYRVWPISGESRRRLRETNRLAAWVSFAPDASNLTVETDVYQLTTPRNGSLPGWERAPGDRVDVATRVQEGRIEQTFDAPDGRRVNVYTLSPDGATLTLAVTITAPRLDGPLTYTQVFRRQ